MAKVTCPACSNAIKYSHEAFHRDFCCPHCGEALVVSPEYLRSLILLSFVIACVPLWLGPRVGLFKIDSWFWDVYLFPLSMLAAFPVLEVLSWIVPIFVRPALFQPQSTTYLTKLGLAQTPSRDESGISENRDSVG
jgi:hypothetical protein